jgi:hypothetical protein
MPVGTGHLLCRRHLTRPSQAAAMGTGVRTRHCPDATSLRNNRFPADVRSCRTASMCRGGDVDGASRPSGLRMVSYCAVGGFRLMSVGVSHQLVSQLRRDTDLQHSARVRLDPQATRRPADRAPSFDGRDLVPSQLTPSEPARRRMPSGATVTLPLTPRPQTLRRCTTRCPQDPPSRGGRGCHQHGHRAGLKRRPRPARPPWFRSCVREPEDRRSGHGTP